MMLFSFRLSNALAARFDAHAQHRGGRSELLRTLVTDYLEAQGEPQPPETVQTTQAAPKIPKVRLDEADLERLDEEAAKVGMTRGQWIEALVRRRLHGQRQLNPEDRARLSHINIELRTLRQRAELVLATARRRLNDGDDAELTIQRIAELERGVRRIGQAVRAGFEGSDAYWDANMDDEGAPSRPTPTAAPQDPDAPRPDARSGS